MARSAFYSGKDGRPSTSSIDGSAARSFCWSFCIFTSGRFRCVRFCIHSVTPSSYDLDAQWVAVGKGGVFLSQDKEVRGITALAFLLLIAFSSAGPIRRYSYPVFFILHYVGVLGFLIFVNRHTVYAQGWATYAIVGIYAVDIVVRLASLRVRYVEVEALEGGMTLVRMPGLRGGWRYAFPPLHSITL